METSIFYTVKNQLGVEFDNCSFDEQLLTYINMAIDVLVQLGVGPPDGFVVHGIEEVWDDFLGSGNRALGMISTYVSLSVRRLWDPPSNSFLVSAIDKQIEELTWRIQLEWMNNVR